MTEDQRRQFPYVTVSSGEHDASVSSTGPIGMIWATTVVISLLVATRFGSMILNAWPPESDLTVLAAVAGVALVGAAALAARHDDRDLLRRVITRLCVFATLGAVTTVSLAVL